MQRRTHPEVIFANIVNELMVSVPSPAYIKAMTAVSPRKIWLCEEGDVVVTPRPIDEPFKRYVCSIIDIDPSEVVTLSPEQGTTDLLPVAVLQSNLFDRLKSLISERPGIDLLPFAVDRPLLELVKKLGLPIHGYRSYPEHELQDVLYTLNTKSGFRQAAERLGMRIVPGLYCEGLDALTRAVEELLPLTGGVIIKQDRSSNGFYHIIFRREDVKNLSLRDYIAERLAAFPHQPYSFTVEALMPFVSVPSVELEVEDEAARLLYICDQRCPNNSFTGMVTPPIELSPAIEQELLKVGQIFGDYVHGCGFRGVCDVDTGLTQDGTLYVTETNFRRTGGTYLDTLLRRLVGEDYLETRVWWADSRLGEGEKDFMRGWDAVQASGLAFDKEQRTGVLLTADTLGLDGKWRYLIVAPSHELAADMEARLERVLQLRELS